MPLETAPSKGYFIIEERTLKDVQRFGLSSKSGVVHLYQTPEEAGESVLGWLGSTLLKQDEFYIGLEVLLQGLPGDLEFTDEGMLAYHGRIEPHRITIFDDNL